MRTSFWEILLIVILVLILFGHSKIPDLMKNLANGINVFKKEIKGKDEDKKEKKTDSAPAAKKAVTAKKPVARKAAPKKGAKTAAKKK
ncbi:MAG: twin-arginine translocase TatA/TatE family subunit [Rickettsiales bacterium]|jgi:sec-independent protein translocase protein TatA|nr:twin-arginine translocase TatA/TatE family subunit [Rickettsiales bacterium]